MKIGHADQRSAFITNRVGYDIVVIKRLSEEMPDLPPENQISDEQWQIIIDAVDAALEKKNT